MLVHVSVYVAMLVWVVVPDIVVYVKVPEKVDVTVFESLVNV